MSKSILFATSDFSLGSSMLQIDKMVELAKEKGYGAIALADEMNLSGMVAFTNRCKKAEIRPVVGVKVRVYDDPTYRKPSKSSGIAPKDNPFFMVKVWPKSEAGMRSLFKLLTKGNSKDYFYYHARVGMKELLELEDCALSTGDMFSVFYHPQCLAKFDELVAKFKGEIFVELVPIDTPLFDELNERATVCLARHAMASKVHAIRTYPTLYPNKGDGKSLDVLKCIVTNDRHDSRFLPRQYVQDFYVQDVGALRPKVTEAIKRGRTWLLLDVLHLRYWAEAENKGDEKFLEVATYEFKKQAPSLPEIWLDPIRDLTAKCMAGWRKRFEKPVLGHVPSLVEQQTVYRQRLVYELAMLKKLGFERYFLLVEDMVTWAKTNGVRVGPGRGSVGGSLVAYLLGITDVDPIRFNLLFERFINPERIDLPDADLDFMSSERHRVVEYLREKYGEDRVVGISNYSTLASASAVRDTGRVFGLSPLDMTATKLVPKEHGQPVGLEVAKVQVAEIEKFADTFPEVWSHALKFEGVMRAYSQHAAGVVVAGEPVVERGVIETRSGDLPVVSWDKRVVEDFGLVKMDLLGLSTLDVLEIASRYAYERHGKHVDYLSIPLEDEDVMDAFGRGNTTGVFQFESPGMKGLLRDLAKGGRLTFDDITAATALYRPGPKDSGLLDDFVAIKQGNRPESYEHPNLKPALKDTYGVIVYQEQVMQVCRDYAGFTMPESDNVRKAMGKKDADKMAEMRDKFIAGAIATSGVRERDAAALWDQIAMFAAYGFNKSHAVEYSIISVWTMWLRVNYPAEYFAACLSIVAEDKLAGLVRDCRDVGIEILPPDVNLSEDRFIIKNDREILSPFNAVKGLSDKTAQAIMRLRNREGGFRDLDHFKDVAGEKNSKVNSRQIDHLDQVGAFASFGGPPARDLSRRKSQILLMPGLIIDAAKAERETDAAEPFLRAKIINMVSDYRKCNGCNLHGQTHPAIRLKSTIKFMVVTDCPTWQEEREGQLMEGDAADSIRKSIKSAGLEVGHGYYTALVKAKKDGKMLTNSQINGCAQWFDRELELVKPSVIVALGSAVIGRFSKGARAGDMIGKTIYDPVLDATIVCGFNPQQIHFDPSKQELLDAIFEEVANILS